MSWNVAVRVTVSACNQDESTIGVATARPDCAPAVTGRAAPLARASMPATDESLTIRTSCGGKRQPGPRRGSRSDCVLLSRREPPRGTGDKLHARLREPEDEDRVAQRVADLEVAARGHRDELFAVHLEDRGGRIHAGAAIELPQDRAGLGVVGFEPAVTLAREYQAAGRGGRAAHHRQVGLHGPRDLSRVQIDRVDVSPLTRVTTLFVRDADEGAAEPEAPVLPRGIV